MQVFKVTLLNNTFKIVSYLFGKNYLFVLVNLILQKHKYFARPLKNKNRLLNASSEKSLHYLIKSSKRYTVAN